MPDLAALFVFPLFLVFFRIGTCLMIFPGFSDLSVNMRLRLLLAFTISLVMFPVLEEYLPVMPASTSGFLMLIFTEIAIGIMMGVSARIMMTAMNFAGELVGFSAGLHAATLFDPRSGASTSAPGLFLAIVGVTLVFVTGLHLLIIQALWESYAVFQPGNLPPIGDAAQAVVGVVADMFVLGLKIAAPIIVAGFLGYAAFGIFNRLIPQLQIFFVALPLTIILGILMLGLTIGSVVVLFSDQMVAHLTLFQQTDGGF